MVKDAAIFVFLGLFQAEVTSVDTGVCSSRPFREMNFTLHSHRCPRHVRFEQPSTHEVNTLSYIKPISQQLRTAL